MNWLKKLFTTTAIVENTKGMKKHLIVGLGNIGPEYVNTRHNIGFKILDYVAQKENVSFQTAKLGAVTEYHVKGKKLILLKPNTYMNLSGKAVKYWMDKEKIPIENSLTVVDEIALPLDKLRLRKGGSDAGHNGLRDIQNILGTDEYPKLRFGIGNNFRKGMQVDYVLNKWFKEEMPIVKIKIEKCVEVIESFATIGIDKTMSLINNLTFAVL